MAAEFDGAAVLLADWDAAAEEDAAAEDSDEDAVAVTVDETVVVTRLDDRVAALAPTRLEREEASVRMEAKSADSEERADTTTEDAPAILELALDSMLLTTEVAWELASEAAALALDGAADMAEEAAESADSAPLITDEARVGFGRGTGRRVAPDVTLASAEEAEPTSWSTLEDAEEATAAVSVIFI